MTKPLEKEKSARPWYLYVIETQRQHLYTGISTDWQRRFDEHNKNTKKCAKALRGKGPLTLKYCIQLNHHSDALKAECWLKKQSRANKVKFITGDTSLPFEHQVIKTTA